MENLNGIAFAVIGLSIVLVAGLGIYVNLARRTSLTIGKNPVRLWWINVVALAAVFALGVASNGWAVFIVV
jgi:hypothetical protein